MQAQRAAYHAALQLIRLGDAVRVRTGRGEIRYTDAVLLYAAHATWRAARRKPL